jgi:hypothetical protein
MYGATGELTDFGGRNMHILPDLMTVRGLKCLIGQITGISRYNQRLFAEGAELQDDKTFVLCANQPVKWFSLFSCSTTPIQQMIRHTTLQTIMMRCNPQQSKSALRQST